MIKVTETDDKTPPYWMIHEYLHFLMAQIVPVLRAHHWGNWQLEVRPQHD